MGHWDLALTVALSLAVARVDTWLCEYGTLYMYTYIDITAALRAVLNIAHACNILYLHDVNSSQLGEAQ